MKIIMLYNLPILYIGGLAIMNEDNVKKQWGIKTEKHINISTLQGNQSGNNTKKDILNIIKNQSKNKNNESG